MKYNRAKLWEILKPFIDFEEGETGDCPELDEILRKVIQHEKGREEELGEMLELRKKWQHWGKVAILEEILE